MIGRWGAAMLPIRGQNNVQGASDMGAIPFVYTDYRTVKDPKIRDEYARAWGVAPESLSLNEGLMVTRSEEHTSELQSRLHLVCRLLLEKKKTKSDMLSS